MSKKSEIIKEAYLHPGLNQLSTFLKDLREEESIDLAKKMLEKGMDPLEIVECCQAAMRDVGQSYETRRFFLSGLMMAGEILRQIMELILPLLEKKIHSDLLGRVLIGTAQGDIHDIGKNLVTMLFRCYGFEVLDLGVDVPPENFVQSAKEFRPDIIAVSVLLTTAHEAVKETIQSLNQTSVRLQTPFKTIIGGGFMDEIVCREIGSDYWSGDAVAGVRHCQKMLSK